MKMIQLMTTILLAIFFSCKKADKSFYSAEQITIISILKGGARGIEYSVPLETLYYSSGCDIQYNQDSTEVNLKFIRQKIKTKFFGDIKSTINQSETKISYFISLPQTVLIAKIDSSNKIINFN